MQADPELTTRLLVRLLDLSVRKPCSGEELAGLLLEVGSALEGVEQEGSPGEEPLAQAPGNLSASASNLYDVLREWARGQDPARAFGKCRQTVSELASRLSSVSGETLAESVDSEALLSGRQAAAELLADIFREDSATTPPRAEQPPASDVPPSLVNRLSDYTIQERIGSGGMATVYRARQISLDREVAIKVLHPGLAQQPHAVERFLRESRAAARVDHPGIISVYDADTENGCPFIVMQLVEGVSLQEMLSSGGRLGLERSLEIVRDVARAVQVAHEAGVTHRDIKPGNILFEEDAESARQRGRVFLGDFGLAALAGAATLTHTGDVLGTPAYMSPEQARGGRTDHRTDVYSLGATLYALLSGRAPHEGTSNAAILSRVASQDPISLRRLNPSLDAEAVAVCGKAMRWDPRARYATAGELAEDLQNRIMRHPVRARPPSLSYRLMLLLKRNPRVVKIAAVVLLLAFAGFVGERAWRRDAILARVGWLLSTGNANEAKGALDEVPWFPSVDNDRQISIWIDVDVARADLKSAVEKAHGLSPLRRQKAYARLRWAVDFELRGADVLLLAGMWRSGLQAIWNAAGGLKALEGVPEAAAAPEDWSARTSRQCLFMAQKGLLYGKHDLVVIPLLDAEVQGASAGRVSDLTYDLLGEFLGTGDASAEPRLQESDTLVSQMLKRTLHPQSVLQSAGKNQSISPDVSVALDHCLPRLLPGNVRFRRQVEILLSLEPVGPESPLPFHAPVAQAVGDVDGDGSDDLVTVVAPATIKIYRWRSGGLQLTQTVAIESQAGEVVEGPAVSLLNLDDAPGREIVVFFNLPPKKDFQSAPGHLRAYRFKAGQVEPFGVEYPPAGERAIDGSVMKSVSPIAAADTGEDEAAALVVGTAPWGTDQRSVWVIRHPFTPEARRFRLPDGGKESDVPCVLAADFDADGRDDIAALTGAWKGFDLRFWKYDAASGKYRGPLRIGPFGVATLGLPVNVDAEPGAELFLAKSSNQVPNDAQFPEEPHLGIPHGLYLYDLPQGGCIEEQDERLSLMEPQRDFLWFDAFSEKLNYPVDKLSPTALSSGHWVDGTVSVCTSWSMLSEGVWKHFVDLYLEGRRHQSFERSRIFRKEGRGPLLAYLVKFMEGNDSWPGMYLLEGGQELEDEWTVRAFRFRSPPAVAPPSAVRRIHAYTRAKKYRRADQLASKILSGRRPPEEFLQINVTRAVVANRALEWDSLAQSLMDLRELLQKEATGLQPGDVERLRARVSHLEYILSRVRSLHTARLRWNWPGDIVVDLKLPPPGPETPEEYTPPSVTRVLLKEVPIDKPMDMELTFDVEVDKLGWDRGVVLGIQGEADPWDAKIYGVTLSCAGGAGSIHRNAHPLWRGHLPPGNDPVNILEEGKSYRYTFIRTADGRVHMKQEELPREGAGPPPGGGRRVWKTYPAYDMRRPIEEEPLRPMNAVPPIRPCRGGYRFVFIDVNPWRESHTRLIFRNLRLTLGPSEDLQQAAARGQGGAEGRSGGR